ncbi:MAG: hypothetical protein WAV22_01370 [Porticoccaceae bacterium]
MTESAESISYPSLGWQLLAKVPWLARWLLRRAFPINKCKERFLVEMPGNHTRFELLSVRPSPALTGLEVRVYNALPFAVDFSAFRLTASINSTGLLDTVLNSNYRIPASGHARIPLSEIGLSDQQANWVRGLPRECARIQVNLHWRCTSSIHDWDAQDTYDCLAYVNKDTAELR